MIKKQTGATTLEFALVLIIYLTFFLGIIDFARMLWTWNAANEATRWGARTAVVCQRDAPAVLQNMRQFLPQLQAQNVQIDWYDADGLSATCGEDSCSGVNVQIVDLDYQWISPVGWSIPDAISMPGFSTYLPKESMGADENSSAVCS